MDFELMYCPYCGGDIDSTDESRYTCRSCGKFIYTDRECIRHFIRPGELEANFEEALDSLEDENPKKALSEADELLRLSEDADFDAYFLRGAVYASIGEDGKAAMDWKRGLELLNVYTNIDAYICLMAKCISNMVYSKEEEFVEFDPVKYIDRICDEIRENTNESCKSFFFYNVYMDYRALIGRKDVNSNETFSEVVPKLFRKVVAYHHNFWCLEGIIDDYLASIGYNPDTYEEDDMEQAHVYECIARNLRKYTSGMTENDMRRIMGSWDDNSLKLMEERLDAMMPTVEGFKLGKILSRKPEAPPVDLEVAADTYARIALLLDPVVDDSDDTQMVQ